MQVYDKEMTYKKFNDTVVFEKWAAIEIDTIDTIPDGMGSYSLSGGIYAVFIHRGPVSTFNKTASYIYGTWLSNSEYEIDDRDHFEILADKYYGPQHPKSEEEVWVPIKNKKNNS
ncbi:GyrI-like domain-containing protein [Aquimarina sp. RZ0]|uniref:GyrI-like domain-containing protein n=1 Tax=Aquimarina sp. RZ0 TaxID=2607730 RepID=UPI002105183A